MINTTIAPDLITCPDCGNNNKEVVLCIDKVPLNEDGTLRSAQVRIESIVALEVVCQACGTIIDTDETPTFVNSVFSPRWIVYNYIESPKNQAQPPEDANDRKKGK